jgi:hypothetical protein
LTLIHPTSRSPEQLFGDILQVGLCYSFRNYLPDDRDLLGQLAHNIPRLPEELLNIFCVDEILQLTPDVVDPGRSATATDS